MRLVCPPGTKRPRHGDVVRHRLRLTARRVLDVCRADAEQCVGNDIPVAVSIGVAQWSPEIGAYPDRLIAAADHAL